MTLATLSSPLVGGGQITLPPIGSLTTTQYLTNLYTAVKTAFGKVLNTAQTAPYLMYGSLFDDQSTAASGSQIAYQVYDGTTGASNNGFLSLAFSLSGTNLYIAQNLQRAWSTSTHTVPSGYTRGANSVFNPSNFNINLNININTLKHPEFALVYLDQGQSALWPLGLIRPYNILNWNTNQAPFLFTPASDSLARICSVYYGETGYPNNTNSQFAFADTYSFLRYSWTGGDGTSSEVRGIPIFDTTSFTGIVGYTSQDLAALPGGNRTRLVDTTTNPDNSIFTFITARTDTSSIGVQTA